MPQKHLNELLQEDQEPFYLQDYIADKQCQIRKQPKRTQIQLKKPKPMSKSSPFSCKNACFFSLQNPPDVGKSPLFEFTSPVHKSPNRVFLHVPAKTASLLLEAAMRIQKPKTQNKNSGFGLFGSFLKRLTNRNRTQKLKSSVTENGEKKREKTENIEEILNANIISTLSTSSSSSSSSSSASSTSCSCNGRQSSLDLESSSSGRSFDEEEDEDGFKFANVVRENGGDSDYGFCLSPLSPFRFALYTSPSPDCRCSPIFASPAKSPARCTKEDNENPGVIFGEEDDEEDKEQNSPVSVLDPPFEDDYDKQDEDIYVFTHRAKHHNKLHSFENFSDLDPLELETRMIEEEEKKDDYEDYEVSELLAFKEQRQVDEFIEQILTKYGFQDIKKHGIKRLISDLIAEEAENTENTSQNNEQVIKRVCKRLESWEEVESNTIDMMVEIDMRRETSEWKKPHEQVGEAAMDIEVAIFRVLVEELLADLSYSS